MRITLELLIDAEAFDTAEAEKADALAISTNGRVYTWKTIGKHNWLEQGFSRVDALCLVVLPPSLPDTVKMFDDMLEEDDDEDEEWDDSP